MSDHARATAKTTANIDELARRLEAAGVCCELDLAGTRVIRCGSGRPDFRLTFRNARALRVAPNESALGRAYISGDLDFDGDPLALLAVRDEIGTDAPLRQKALFVFQLFLRRPTSLNKPTLDQHYTLGDDFYLTFMDRRYRLYSQCIFRSGSDALEDAAEQKLEQMWDALQLRPGMRLLDIGGGWGGVTEYCAARGVAVTTLTLVDSSAQYIRVFSPVGGDVGVAWSA